MFSPVMGISLVRALSEPPITVQVVSTGFTRELSELDSLVSPLPPCISACKTANKPLVENVAYAPNTTLRSLLHHIMDVDRCRTNQIIYVLSPQRV
jgi:hypothetical protein